MVIPLSEVARLEQISRDKVELAGSQEVVQYRGGILPLMHLSQVLPERRSVARVDSGDDQPSDVLQVVVHTSGDRLLGLVVDRIIDIVEESVELERAASRDGVLGTAVIQGRVTELLDLDAVGHGADQSATSIAA
jgi:two-component system chemotaxis sensor kinase CheA